MKELKLVKDAKRPEDIFGKAEDLTKMYRKLRSVLHPDHANGNVDQLNEAFAKLTAMHDLALDLIKNGTYGKSRVMMTLSTKHADYDIVGPLTEFTTGKPVAWSAAAQFFKGTHGAGPVLIKISTGVAVNQLMKNELKVLEVIKDTWPKDNMDPKIVANMMARFALVIDSFETIINGVNRVVTVMSDPGPLVSLGEIIRSEQYHASLIPRKHIAWMWRRLLETLMHVEEAGYVIGSINPDNLLFNLDTHEIRVLDLCHAVKLGSQVMTSSTKHQYYHPPEITNKKPAGPSTDTYMGALCMLNAMETGTDTGLSILKSYFAAASLSSASARTENALTLYRRYDDIIHNRLGWKKHFVAFPLSKNQGVI